MTTQTQDSIVEKVRAILDRANHPNTPPAEAETALALAQRLITKYSLDEGALARAEHRGEEVVTDTLDVFGSYALRRLTVASEIAKANGVARYRTSVWNEKGGKGYRLHLYGTKADIFATQVLFQSAEALALRSIPQGDRSFRTSWWVGFAVGVGRALTKASNEVATETTGSALVLRDRLKRADDEMRAQVSGLRAVQSAYGAGLGTGSTFNSNGIGRGAIGAIGR